MMDRLKHITILLLLILLASCIEMPSNLRGISGGPETALMAPVNQVVDSHYNTASHRIALVIGNGDYPTAPLTNPPNDAKDIAHALKRLGFEVLYAENADQTQMQYLIESFTEKLLGASLGLFYFAGHGAQYGHENFLMPAGLAPASNLDIQRHSTAAGEVLAAMEQVGTPTKVIILDACRNSPFGNSGLARMAAQAQHNSGAFIAYATTPGDTAEDGEGHNSPYTKGLLNFIHQGLPIEILFKKVRTAVRQATGGRQTPWEHTSLEGGNLCLAPCIEADTNITDHCQMRVSRGLYEGECQNNVPHGQGVMRYADGEYYKGSFSNGVRHGFGTQYLTDGTEMAGTWMNGRIR